MLQKTKRWNPKVLININASQRVFQYATKWDYFAYAAGILASIGAGITLPLMNVVFGMSFIICFFLHPFLAFHVAVLCIKFTVLFQVISSAA